MNIFIDKNFTQTLTALILFSNPIGAQGTQHLSAALQTNTVIVITYLLFINACIPFDIDTFNTAPLEKYSSRQEAENIMKTTLV